MVLINRIEVLPLEVADGDTVTGWRQFSDKDQKAAQPISSGQAAFLISG